MQPAAIEKLAEIRRELVESAPASSWLALWQRVIYSDGPSRSTAWMLPELGVEAVNFAPSFDSPFLINEFQDLLPNRGDVHGAVIAFSWNQRYKVGIMLQEQTDEWLRSRRIPPEVDDLVGKIT